MDRQSAVKKPRIRLDRLKTLILAAVLVPAALFIAYYAGVSGGRQETLSALDSRQEEAKPSQTPAVTGRLLEQRLSSLPRLVSVEYRYTNMGKFEDQKDFYGWSVPFTTKRFILSYEGVIYAGLEDISQLQVAVDQETMTVTVTLPPCAILSHEIFEDSLEVLDETSSIFNPIRIGDYAGFAADQKEAAERKAVAGGLLNSAREKAREAVAALLSQAPGMERYTLTVQ